MNISIDKKIIFIFILLILVYFGGKKCLQKYETYKNTRENKFILDKSEFPEEYKTIELNKLNNSKDEDIKYIVWSGGVSSTFRLCELLLIEQKKVQPIYIHTQNFGSYQNHNQMEIKSMKKIREILYKDYPILKERLEPTMYVTKIKKEPTITKKFKNLHQNYNMFDQNEKKSKYENIARFSIGFDKEIELPIDSQNKEINNALKPYLKDIYKNNSIHVKKIDLNIPVHLQDLHIFDKCLFPIIHLEKNTIKMLSIQYNFFYIIKLTWSCNQPTEKYSILYCLNCDNCLKEIFKPNFHPILKGLQIFFHQY